MKHIIKKAGKIIKAYCLGEEGDVVKALMNDGKIIKRADGTYEVFSQEAVNGGGEVAEAVDYIKLDSKGFPYPNSREFFEANHRHVQGDEYEQIPKPIMGWNLSEELCEEIQFLVAQKGLLMGETSEDKYFTAPLWGNLLSAAKDAWIVFYDIAKTEDGEIKDVDFNFVERTEFYKLYNIIE